jgi:hypothetical protein
VVPILPLLGIGPGAPVIAGRLPRLKNLARPPAHFIVPLIE